MSEAVHDRHERWSARGRELTLQGRFHSALRAYRAAHEIARREADDCGRENAAINIAMVRIQMGDARAGEDGLREILLRSRDDRTAFSAAYNLASSLRKQGRHEKAMAYATRALDRADALDAIDLRAAVRNLIGNIHLNGHFLNAALDSYHESLALRSRQPGDTRYSRAILLENIGYCRLLRGELEDGVATLRDALELAGEVGDRRCAAECLQDLCYAHLLRDHHDEAVRFGDEALEAAIEGGYRDIEENCHYLLGELGRRTGEPTRTDHHFDRLQTMHPELPFLKDFLCTVDVTSFITLKR